MGNGKSGKAKKSKKAAKDPKAGKSTKLAASELAWSVSSSTQSTSGVVQVAVGAIVCALVAVMATTLRKKLNGNGSYTRVNSKALSSSQESVLASLGLSSSVSLLQSTEDVDYRSYGMVGGVVEDYSPTSSLITDGVLE